MCDRAGVMMGRARLVLLLLVFISGSLADVRKSVMPGSIPMDTLAQQADPVGSQLVALAKSLGQKDLYLLDQDKVISSLQKKIQELKEHDSNQNQEMLDETKAKIEDQEAKAAELEEALERKNREIFNLKGRAQNIEAAEGRHVSEIKQLEKDLVSQGKQLDKLQEALYVTEEYLIELQARVNAKEQELDKVYKQWLPPWAAKHLTHSQNLEDSQTYVLRKRWKKAILVVIHYIRIYKCKGLKHLEATKTLALTHLKEAQKDVKNKLEVAFELSRPYMDGPITVLGPYLNRMKVFSEPYRRKLTQFYDRALKYAIKHHLQLQRKVWKALKKNKYLASIASKEVVWFLASALLILPLYGTLKLVSSSFSAKRGSRFAKGAATCRHRQVKQPQQVHK